jgi:cell division protein FtsN
VLTDAVRDGSTTPMLRQNLAYAYALDGRWADASLTAGFDLPPDRVNARLQQWAQSMQSGGERVRIARLLGAPVTGDPGMPASLALNGSAAPVRTAPTAETATVTSDSSGEVPKTVAVQMPTPIAVAPERAVTAAAMPAPADPPVVHGQGALPNFGHFVQLGAYHSLQSAERGRLVLAKQYSQRLGQGLLITQAKFQGRGYWLVVMAGFDGRKASSICASLKRQGGACLAYSVKPGSVRTGRQGRSLALADRLGMMDRR